MALVRDRSQHPYTLARQGEAHNFLEGVGHFVGAEVRGRVLVRRQRGEDDPHGGARGLGDITQRVLDPLPGADRCPGLGHQDLARHVHAELVERVVHALLAFHLDGPALQVQCQVLQHAVAVPLACRRRGGTEQIPSQRAGTICMCTCS